MADKEHVTDIRDVLNIYCRGHITRDRALQLLVGMGHDEGMMNTFLNKPVETIRMQLDAVSAEQLIDVPHLENQLHRIGPALAKDYADEQVRCPECGKVMKVSHHPNRPGFVPYSYYRCNSCDAIQFRGTVEGGVGVMILSHGNRYQAILTNGKLFAGEIDTLTYHLLSTSHASVAYRQRFVLDRVPVDNRTMEQVLHPSRGALILPVQEGETRVR
jgi:hypothetical protein